MKRKDKTVKQLQAECRKRKVGFMMNWTKVALIKRLEDEDKKDKLILELEKKADKVLVKKEEELSIALKKQRIANRELGKLDKGIIKENAIGALIKQKQTILSQLEVEFDALQIKQNEVLKENSIISHRKAEIHKEIESLKILIKSLI
jgi:hypothetical protein